MGACTERSKHSRTSAYANGTYEYVKGAASSQYANYKERQLEMAEAVLNSHQDDSDTQVITFYEENGLHLRHVILDDFEERLKKFVYNKPTIMLKQLQEAFKGNSHLEKIL